MAVESHSVTPEAHDAARAGDAPYPGAEQNEGAPKPPAPEEAAKAPSPEPEPEPEDEAGDQPTDDSEGDESEESEESSLDYQSLYSEFAERGELSEESLASVKKALPQLPEGVIETYLQGLRALQAQAVSEGYSVVGGQENYSAMVEWARGNLSEQEIAEYNTAMDRGPAAAKFAIQGLYARYSAESGSEPSLAHAGRPASGDPPIRSRADLVSKIRDPRYAKDPAFRAQVERELAASMNHDQYKRY